MIDGHHAKLILSNQDQADVLATIIKEYSVEAEVVSWSGEVLSIAEVRSLIERAYQTPGSYSYRLMLVQARVIAIEAQQALLKILEEPPKTTRFLFVLPGLAGVLPTVLSRLFVIDQRQADNQLPESFVEFYQATIPDRLLYVASLAKNKDETLWAELATGLMLLISRGDHDFSLAELKTFSFVLNNQQSRGASKKMLWEEVAFTLKTP